MPLRPARDRSRWPSRRLLTAAAAILVAWSCHPTSGSVVTPSDVYQIVDTLNAELSVLVVATGGHPERVVDRPPPTERQPRHVLQKAREVMLKVQILRAQNGLQETPLPAFPVAEAVPADSKIMVNAILQDVLDLRSKFNVTGEVRPTPAFSRKTPTDVYANLQRASDMLDALGLPRTMPNDVYRVTVMINRDLEAILTARGRPLPAPAPTPGTNEIPDDSYAQAYAVLDRLRAKIDAEPDLAIPGGIVLPARLSPPLTPNDVLDLENNLLAELGAIEAVLGITNRATIPPLVHGRTSSDIFDLLIRAQTLVDAL